MHKTSGGDRIFTIISSLTFILVVSGFVRAQVPSQGTLKQPIVDSRMTKQEAFDGLDPKCPEEIRKKQMLLKVKYYSTDQKVHQGQLVIDRSLKKDVRKIFALALKERFPIYSVIPISDKRFRKDGRWDDELSMEANNSSAFNYREITGGGRISNHAYGRAIDINTFFNPYIKGTLSLPKGAKYDPAISGTFTRDNPLVQEFIRLGWDWGGNWASPVDYQHFEKPPKGK